LWDQTTFPGVFESLSAVYINSNQAFIDFNNIPQVYSSLQIRGVARTNRGNSSDSILGRANSDSTNSYTLHGIQTSGNISITSFGTGDNSFFINANVLTGSLAASQIFGAFVIDLLGYSDQNKYTTTKTFGGAVDNSLGPLTGFYGSSWMKSDRITSLRLFSYASFVQGTFISLYGIRG
jgi:hypothetical protein